MIDAISRARAFAPAATSVILHGESGTGKTFFAEFIHDLSQRAGGFHAFSVGIVAPQLALDELFGHVPGAFTDARKMRTGRFAAAGGGTLLLDDIHTLDLGVQKQLLQVLDRRTYSAVGCDRVQTVACRIILAMTEDPDTLMRQGILLKDLRYRFGACAIRMPPLRERRAEIPLLAHRALATCPEQTKVEGPTRFSESALALLSQGDYEGNVRELGAVVEYAYLMARAGGAREVAAEHMPEGLCLPLRYRRRGDPIANRAAVTRALRRTAGNVTQAASLLGISRNSLHALLADQRTDSRSRKSEAS
jgi:DNA-binding NtrC family response regulator